MNVEQDQPAYDWKQIVDRLQQYLRLKTTPIGMKLFTRREEMEVVPTTGYSHGGSDRGSGCQTRLDGRNHSGRPHIPAMCAHLFI